MKVLLKHPSVHLHMLWQWKWGAEAQKPTGVLAIGLPTLMHRHCLDEVTKPTTEPLDVPAPVSSGLPN